MKKTGLWLTVISLLLLVTAGSAAAEQVRITGYAGLGNLRVTGEDNITSSQWLGSVTAEAYPTNDLRAEGSWMGGFSRNLSMGGEELAGVHTAAPWRIHGAVGYLLMEDDGFRVYGGLSYELARVSLRHPAFTTSALRHFTGQGFGMHGHASFEIMDQMGFSASVHGAPWFSWEYQEGNRALKNIRGSSFAYQLNVHYNIQEDIAVHVGYASQRAAIASFDFQRTDDTMVKLPKSSTAFSGLTLGASISF